MNRQVDSSLQGDESGCVLSTRRQDSTDLSNTPLFTRAEDTEGLQRIRCGGGRL